MAIYVLNVETIGREKGGRVTRSAAYRAGERIRDERTRETYDFSDRDDVVHKEIFLPAHFAGHPGMDWARDRSTLWNAVEHTDRRNARLGREVLVVLPPELTPAQRTQLVRKFSQEISDRYRSAVDATIHLPRPTADDRHHHAHLLMTPRQVTPHGLGPRTALELSGVERHTAGLGPYKVDFMWTRERWAHLTNEALKEAGLTARVDHRSLQARGIDREPTLPIPKKILYLERKSGHPTEAGEALRRHYRERVAARLQGPEELARVLQRQKEERRQYAMERARQKEQLPKKASWSSLTKEDIAQRRRDHYQLNQDTLRAKRRAYYRQQSKPTVEKAAIQHWQQWRVQQMSEAQARAQEQTAEGYMRRWLAQRETPADAHLAQTASKDLSGERVFRSPPIDREDDDRRRRLLRDQQLDYGL